MASACHISYLNQRALAGAIGHAICTCVLLFVHTDQTSLVSGFSNRRQNEGALSLLESHLVRLFNPFPRLIPIENKHGNHTMPLWPGCQPTGWNMWREEDNGQNYNMRHTVKGEGGDKYETANLSRLRACEANCSEMSACAPLVLELSHLSEQI